VAATNVNIPEAIEKGKFRQDLFYRLNTVPILIPPLRERKSDILLLFKKFANDFAEKYRMPVLQLSDDAMQLLENYRWPGNIRQLKNMTEQISIIEKTRIISAQTLKYYIPADNSPSLPILYNKEKEDEKISERDILYKVLFDMKRDLLELKKTVATIMEHSPDEVSLQQKNNSLVKHYPVDNEIFRNDFHSIEINDDDFSDFQHPEIVNESLSLHEKEMDLIRLALEKHHGKRKNAAKELGISERTLYRKIKEYDIDL